MSSSTSNKKRPRGRPHSGRVTEPFNMRILRTIKQRLVQSASVKRPQRIIVEEALDKVLPPLKEITGAK